jgi:hypothetical protein
MAAWSVFGRAAGMENGGSLIRRQTRQFQILECRGGDGRYFRPLLRVEIPHLSTSEAKTSVWLVEFTLELEQSQREFSKGRVGPYGFPGPDEALEVTCEFRKFGDGLHAVFILPGWFSATAWNKYLTERIVYGK